MPHEKVRSEWRKPVIEVIECFLADLSNSEINGECGKCASRRNRDATAPGDAPFAVAAATGRTRRSDSKIERLPKEQTGA